MTFEEAKDQVAINNGFKNWTEFVEKSEWSNDPIKQVSELYAKSKWEEACKIQINRCADGNAIPPEFKP